MVQSRSESCEAELTIKNRTYPGYTGRGHGHAEMDALHNFITLNDRSLDILQSARNKTVSCPSRPCCRKCSAVLKKLGFKTVSGSSFSDTPMGSTEWGVSLEVRKLLTHMGIKYEHIQAL